MLGHVELSKDLLLTRHEPRGWGHLSGTGGPTQHKSDHERRLITVVYKRRPVLCVLRDLLSLVEAICRGGGGGGEREEGRNLWVRVEYWPHCSLQHSGPLASNPLLGLKRNHSQTAILGGCSGFVGGGGIRAVSLARHRTMYPHRITYASH